MSEHTLHLLTRLRQRLQATMRRVTLAQLAYGALLTFGLCSAAFLLAATFEAIFWLGSTTRTLIFWTYMAAAGGLVTYFLVLPILRFYGYLPGITEEALARRIGSHFPEISDRFVNMLQLADGHRSGEANPLVDRAVRMLGSEVHPVQFEQVERFERARRVGRLASLPVLGLFLFVVAAPEPFYNAAARLFSPGITFERPAPFSFQVEPGSIELARGASLELIAATIGQQLPHEIVLHVVRKGEQHEETRRLSPDSTGMFRHMLVNVRQPVEYYFSAGAVKGQRYDVRITERPLIRSLQVTLEYPSYTGIPPRRLDPNVGDVAALPGTRVSVDVALTGEEVHEAFLVFDEGETEPLELKAGLATGAFSLRKEGQYHVLLRNAGGVSNNDPILYNLRVLADEHPSVVLLDPGPSEDLNESLRADLRMRITDDFGFSRLRLYYRLAESRYGDVMDDFAFTDLPLASPSVPDQELAYNWLLAQATDLDLVPDDVVEYFVRVWDNDAVAGYKPAQSATHTLRFPSLAEQYRRLEEEQDRAGAELESVLSESETVRREFEALRDALRSKQEADWDDKRQLERLMQQEEQLEQRVEQLSEQIENITDQMEANDLVSDETLELYQQLQKVVDEINSPELMEALKQLQEAMENLDLSRMQQSIQQFEFSEEQYRQRLERTLELFKRLQTEQRLEESSRLAEELARQQERLAEETQKLDEDLKQDASDQEQAKEKSEQLAQEQQRSQQDMQRLEEQIERARQQMEEMRRAPKEEMDRLQEQLRRQELPQKMEQNSQQLQQGELDEAQQGQQEMQQQLEQLSEQLNEMREQMSGNQMSVNLAGLRRSLSDVLTLSRLQENLRAELRDMQSDGPATRQLAQRQVELSAGLSVLTDSLQQLARSIPQMTREVQQKSGDALREMGNAVEAMADGRSPQASGFQKSSMTSLNDLALLLSELLDQLRNSQQDGGGGDPSMQQMIQQLQQMAQQQQELNQQIQDLLNDMQGDRLTQDQEQRLQQISAQQEAIRRQLQEMSQNKELGDRVLGSLERIAEQMEETIREMQNRQMGRPTVERQQQILTRLLEAQRSLRERGRERRREGRSGDDVLRESPADLTPSEQTERLRRDLIRALDSGYAPDYEELIKRYFDLLQRQGNGE